MKNNILLIVGIAAIAAACTHETNSSPVFREEALHARIASTRTSFSNSAGLFSWSKGDDIAVYRTTNGYETTPLTEDGCFNVHLSATETRDGFAIYPARIAKAESYSASSLTINLPTEYTIPSEGMGEEAPLPMIAINDPEEEDLLFHHIGGLLQLTLNSVPYETAILSVDLGKRITGDFTISNPGSYIPQISTDATAGENVRFILDIPLSSPRDGYILNIPIPTGSFSDVSVQALDFKNNLLAEGNGILSEGTVGRAEGIRASLSLANDPSLIPLTIKAMWAGTVTIDNPLGLTIEYSSDNQSWDSDNGSELSFSLERGESLFLRGNNKTYATGEIVDSKPKNGSYTNIRSTAPFYLYGNILSLTEGASFAGKSDLANELGETELYAYAFAGLFMNNPYIQWNPSFPLLLPDGILSEGCFSWMFCNTNITTAPALPSTTLSPKCYYYMFEKCAQLSTAPVLPATVMASHCYDHMFFECKHLTTPPALPATTLAEACYKCMFYSTGLTSVPSLPASTMEKECYMLMFDNTNIASVPNDLLQSTELAQNCYQQMFSGNRYLANAPDLPATQLANDCYRFMFSSCTALVNPPLMEETAVLTRGCYCGMFQGCSNLTTAPNLPATTLEDECYSSMFKSCKKLETIPAVLPATTAKKECYKSMFQDCVLIEHSPIIRLEGLAENCCREMFSGCTALNSVTAMFLDAPQSDYTLQWLNGVASDGTFYKNPSASWNSASGFTRGVTTVPSGWDIENASL